MVGQAGFEPATTRLEGGCSIQLSYWPTAIFATLYAHKKYKAI